MEFNHVKSLLVYASTLLTYGFTLTSALDEMKLILLVLTCIFTIIKGIDIIRSWRKPKNEKDNE
jgi:hypothetical protein